MLSTLHYLRSMAVPISSTRLTLKWDFVHFNCLPSFSTDTVVLGLFLRPHTLSRRVGVSTAPGRVHGLNGHCWRIVSDPGPTTCYSASGILQTRGNREGNDAGNNYHNQHLLIIFKDYYSFLNHD